MTLVDTSVWIDHLRGRRRARALAALLEAGDVLTHPFVVGELALGGLGRRRGAILADLARLPAAPLLGHGEALVFLEAHGLAGSGIGWVDVHILGTARLAGAFLWTHDGRLGRVAAEMGLAAPTA